LGQPSALLGEPAVAPAGSFPARADEQPVASSEATAATYDAALVEDFGPRPEQPGVERQRLGWSLALSGRQAHRRQDEKRDEATWAIDLLLPYGEMGIRAYPRTS